MQQNIVHSCGFVPKICFPTFLCIIVTYSLNLFYQGWPKMIEWLCNVLSRIANISAIKGRGLKRSCMHALFAQCLRALDSGLQCNLHNICLGEFLYFITINLFSQVWQYGLQLLLRAHTKWWLKEMVPVVFFISRWSSGFSFLKT